MVFVCHWLEAMTLLLSLLGVVLCSLAGSSQVLPQADFNTQAAAGKWYLVGFATNTQWFVNHRDNMNMGMALFTPTAEGDLELSYSSLRADGSCWRMDNLARRTDVPGKFFYTSSDSDNNMIIVEAKYDEHILVHVIKTKGAKVSVVNKLYGRSPDLSNDLQEKFRQFSLETGVEAENIAFLPKNGECTSA